MAVVKFTQEHEWVSISGDLGTVGITDYAQGQLGDVVYVELPEVGASYIKGAEAAVVESVKAAAEVYAPIDGDVVEANEGLAEDPALVNSDAQVGGWFFKLRISDASQLDSLMDEEAYNVYVADLD